jgi:hypothetical protein
MDRKSKIMYDVYKCMMYIIYDGWTQKKTK